MNITEIKLSKEEKKKNLIKLFNEFFDSTGFYDALLDQKSGETNFVSFAFKKESDNSITLFKWEWL